jgi:hypothetical protein
MELDRWIARARGKRIVKALPLEHDVAAVLPCLGLKNGFWFALICWY